MNAMDYSLLIKEQAMHDKIAKKQRFKTMIFWLILPFCFVPLLISNYLPEDTNPIVSLVLSLSVFALLLYELFYNLHFFRFLDRVRKEQTLDANNPEDKDFFSLNQKYSSHLAFVKKILMIATVTAAVCLVASVSAVATGAAMEIKTLEVLGGVFFAVFFIVILIAALAVAFKQMKLAKTATDEVENIKRTFFKKQGLTDEEIAKKRRNIFSNAYDSQKILAYQYPDEEIRKKVQKLSFLIIVPAAVLGGIAGGVGASAAMLGKSLLFYLTIGIFAVAFTLSITLTVLALKKQIKKQRDIFEADKDKYRLHLQLADLTKKHQRKSNMCMLIALFAAATAGVLLSVFVADNVTQVGVIAFLCLIGFLVLVLAFFVPMFRNYRVAAKKIEVEIDLATLSSDKVFEGNPSQSDGNVFVEKTQSNDGIIVTDSLLFNDGIFFDDSSAVTPPDHPSHKSGGNESENN